jgi:hypothetical protein
LLVKKDEQQPIMTAICTWEQDKPAPSVEASIDRLSQRLGFLEQCNREIQTATKAYRLAMTDDSRRVSQECESARIGQDFF